MFKRYALYYTPSPESSLSSKADVWFYADARRHPASDWVIAPSRYGFHATLKAPMRLAVGMEKANLFSAVDAFAKNHKRIALGLLHVTILDGFLAFTPERQSQELSDFAFSCVRDFDYFRAPISDEDIARRGKLNAGQDALLRRWGYPHVGDHFRFHMTLTSSLDRRELERATHAAHDHFNDVLNLPVWLDNICVFGDPGNGQPFEIIQRFPLLAP